MPIELVFQAASLILAAQKVGRGLESRRRGDIQSPPITDFIESALHACSLWQRWSSISRPEDRRSVSFCLTTSRLLTLYSRFSNSHSARLDEAAFEVPDLRETDEVMQFAHRNARNWCSLGSAVRSDVFVRVLKCCAGGSHSGSRINR